MAQRRNRVLTVLGATALGVALGGCTSQNAKIQEHAEKLRSLRATTAAIDDAWTRHDLSPTFARVALEQTFQLLQEERASIARRPEDLAVPAAAALVRDSEDLSRHIAALVRELDERDKTAALRRLADRRAAAPERR